MSFTRSRGCNISFCTQEYIMKMRLPSYDKWKAFRDESYKSLTWLGLVIGIAWAAWQFVSPRLGVAAPYFLGALPLLLVVFIGYSGRHADRTIEESSFLPLALFLSLLPLIPSLLFALFMVYDGRVTLLNVHLWTFVGTSALVLFVAGVGAIVWIVTFHSNAWRRLLFIECLLTEIMRDFPADKHSELLRTADTQCREHLRSDSPSGQPMLTKGVRGTFQGC
jgi:hypothetical protein